MSTQTTGTGSANNQVPPSPLPPPAQMPPVAVTALCVIAVCAVVGLAYLLVPGFRSKVEVEQAKATVRQMGSEVDSTQRDKVMDQSKMIGLALLTYAQDYDGYLPPPGADAKALLSDSYALKGMDTNAILGPWQNSVTGEEGSPFVYTLAKPFSMFKSDAYDIEAGYKELTPGNGKVVIFTTGAAKWFPSK